MQEWERLTERLGFWVDLDEAYVTYHQSYVESVWWSLKKLFDRGLLVPGPQNCLVVGARRHGALGGEVGQGYREVADPSVYVKFPLVARRRQKTSVPDDDPEYVAAGLDNHALDAAEQSVCGGASGRGVLDGRSMTRTSARCW